MNTQFANYTTSSAFTLTMNRTAITEIVEMFIVEDENIRHLWAPWQVGTTVVNRATVNYLLRRGLVRNISNDIRDKDEYCLTRAGILTAQLLIEAGFCDTPMIEAIRRMHRPMNTKSDNWFTEERIRERWGHDFATSEETTPTP